MIYEKFGQSKKMNPNEYGGNKQLLMIKMDLYALVYEFMKKKSWKI